MDKNQFLSTDSYHFRFFLGGGEEDFIDNDRDWIIVGLSGREEWREDISSEIRAIRSQDMS